MHEYYVVGLLKKVERGLLVARMEAAAKDRRKDGLVYGGVTFDDWGYQRHDFINCT